MNRSMTIRSGFAALLCFLLAACGGGGGSSSSSSTTTPPVVAAQPNTMAISVDAGPAALTNIGEIAANTLYASVTVCTPGSTVACRVVDHVQVDTGSTGLRIIASALTGAVPTPVTDPASGKPLNECVQFADGYSWGSVGTADVTMGSRVIGSLPIHLIGDPVAGSAPSNCVSGPEEDTTLAFGANGVLGIGNFLQDCGGACAQQAIAGTYYICTTAGNPATCVPTIVATARQVPNPISRFSTDNNGVVVQLPAVAAPGANSASGTLLFGVATQTNNALGSARIYTLDGQGTFVSTFGGATQAGSFIDSGSNAYFFPASGIAVCADAAFFYCPVTAGNVATTLSLTGTITGSNGLVATISFQVANADQLFNSNFTAFPGLAGPNGSLINGAAGAFDWGLPFFFGRPVSVLIEGSSVNGSPGPAVAF